MKPAKKGKPTTRQERTTQRNPTKLVASLEHGCEMYTDRWGNVLCKKPIAMVIQGKVAICNDCWRKAQRVGQEILAEERAMRDRVDPPERRQKIA
jgi:hypothetical protein